MIGAVIFTGTSVAFLVLFFHAVYNLAETYDL